MSSLPQEILDKIVGHVDAHLEPEHLFQAFQSHRNLALTARCFVHGSYSRIYEKVKFRHEALMSFGRPPVTPSYKKRINFEAHPRLIQYIRHVEVSAPFACPRRNRCGGLYQSFASIAERLTKVERIHLHSSRVVDWDDVAPGCRKTIEYLASINPISELIVSNITNLPLATIFSVSSLSKITVIHRASVSSGSSYLQDQDLRLTSYTHRSPTASALGTLFSPQFPSLYANLVFLDLSINSTDTHDDAWSTVLSAHGHPLGLKALRIVYGESTSRQRPSNLVSISCRDILNTGKSLPSFPHLTSLSLELLADRDLSEQEPTTTLPSFFPRFLHQLLHRNSQPSLETLEILMRWRPTVEIPMSLQHWRGQPILSPHDAEWKVVDEVLSNKMKLPSIRAIRLYTQYRYSNQLLYELEYGDIGGELLREARRTLRSEIMAALSNTANRLPGLVVDVNEGS